MERQDALRGYGLALAALLVAACSSGGGDGPASPVFEEDLDPPVISGVQVLANGSGRATVIWTTNEPASSRVDYGTGPGYGSRASSGNQVASHSLALTGLTAGTTYHFQVTSVDASGNSASTPDSTFENSAPAQAPAEVGGALVAWHPLTLTFRGPTAGEGDVTPNPFLDYRMTVDFTGPSGTTTTVPGFFDGDGNGGGTGNAWRVRFAPNEGGTWSYTASFRQGLNAAVNLSPSTGSPTSFDGASGTVQIAPRNASAEGFYRWGKLMYVGGHYLKFSDGPYFIKTGTNSPENLLGYAGFDNTFDQPGGLSTSGLANGVHRFPNHVGDWKSGDPLFTSADTGYDSKGLIGALNYISSKGVNAVYFMPMNLGGDGREAYPFVGPADTAFDKTHYDISKLTQWNQVLEHATSKGILLHVVLGETELENETWLDGGTLGVQRKLFYREMIARFGHALAIKWNLTEENDYFSPTQLTNFADYIQRVDPYDHPIAVHSNVLPTNGENPDWTALLGDPRFSSNSIQAIPWPASDTVEKWRADSAAAGREWVVEFDEQTVATTGGNAVELRQKLLYDVLFSGGHIEWYAGYQTLPLGGDLRQEDFRTREDVWEDSLHARRCLEQHVPFWRMQPDDALVKGESQTFGGAEVLASHDEAYAIYYPDTTATGTLELAGTSGSFTLSWYDPGKGGALRASRTVSGGGSVTVGAPPSGNPDGDWVVLVTR